MKETQGKGVLLDTSVWVCFFRPRGHEKLKAEVQKALAAGRVFTCWVVKAELLVGAKDEKAFDQLRSALEALKEVDISPELWEAAARLGHVLRRQGIIIPLPDLLIAEAALSAGLEFWHADEHFERIQNETSLRARSFFRSDEA